LAQARALVSYGLQIAFDLVSLTWIFLGSLDVLSLGFGNENDLHGLMKLSAFSPLRQWGVVGCITWLFRGRRLDLSTLGSSWSMSQGDVVGGYIAYVLGLLGFSKILHSAST
jgi:hypothetical protein